MRTLRWLIVGSICLSLATPTRSDAQAREEDQGFSEMLRSLFGPNWNLFAHGGLSTSGRYMLQRPVAGGERALRSDGGYNVGVGAGVDILPRAGFRLSYTYNSSDLEFRTDNGDGSQSLDLDDVGTLQSHVAALEVIRYMLPSWSSITPYGAAGFVGTWWVLDDESAFVTSGGESTQFRFGALATIGVQFRLAEHFNVRMEMAAASVRSPFTGNESFIALGGTTIDEPTRVTRNDFRLVALYSFGRRDEPPIAASRRRRVR